MILTYETDKTLKPIKFEIDYEVDGFYNNTDCGGSDRDYTAEIVGIYYKKTGKTVGDIVWRYLRDNEDFNRRFQENLEL